MPSVDPPVKGDTLWFDGPLSNHGTVQVKWSQNLSNKEAKYYQIIANDTRTNETALLFVDADVTAHSTKFEAYRNSEGRYDVVIDSDFFYGQKSADGTDRFVILHDPSRKIYQHRFVTSNILSGIGKKIGGEGGIAGDIANEAQKIFGDYLHKY